MMNKYRLLENQGEPGCEYLRTRPLLQDSRNSRPLLNAIFILETVLLILSIAGNGFQYWFHHHGASDDGFSGISELDVPIQILRIMLIWTCVAGVTAGIVRPFVTHTEWSSENSSRADDLWNALAPEVGMVVVDNGLSRQMDLYDTSTFPWDHGKSIYMLEGFHSLHCLVRPYIMYVCSNDSRADDFLERCPSTERYANSNEAFRKPLLCIITSTVSTHSERTQSVQQTTH